MNNISEETTKKKQIVRGLHLLRDYLSHSNKGSLNLSSQTLSRLKSLFTKLSHSGKEINSSNSQDDKNKRIKDLEYAAKNDKELGSVDSLRNTFVFSVFFSSFSFEIIVVIPIIVTVSHISSHGV